MYIVNKERLNKTINKQKETKQKKKQTKKQNTHYFKERHSCARSTFLRVLPCVLETRGAAAYVCLCVCAPTRCVGLHLFTHFWFCFFLFFSSVFVSHPWATDDLIPGWRHGPAPRHWTHTVAGLRAAAQALRATRRLHFAVGVLFIFFFQTDPLENGKDIVENPHNRTMTVSRSHPPLHGVIFQTGMTQYMDRRSARNRVRVN